MVSDSITDPSTNDNNIPSTSIERGTTSSVRNNLESKIEIKGEKSSLNPSALPKDGILDSLRGLFKVESFNTGDSTTTSDETDVEGFMPDSEKYSDTDTVEKLDIAYDFNYVQHPKVLCEKYQVGVASILDQQDRKFLRNGIKFTLLIAGQTGLGKTTFINTLFGTDVVPTVWDMQKKTKEVLPTSKICAHDVKVVDKKLELNFNIIDTPGFCSQLNNSFAWSPIVNYIDEQYRSFMFQEEQPIRTATEDHRVHCCLYFIKIMGSGLSSLDIRAMKEISKRCNLIPIMPKTDAYTTEEKNNHKQVIRQILEEQGIKVCSFLNRNDHSADGIMKDFPFALICSQDIVTSSDGKKVRGREYKWGVAEVDNPQHSEFSLLRDIIFSSNLVDLVDGTKNYYENYRSHLLMSRINQAKKNSVKDSKLLSLDFDSPEKNSLGNYWVYEIYNKSFIDALVVEWSSEFIYKQSEAQKKLNEKVLLEEQRFKRWKTELVSNQNKLNQEIESIHSIVKRLDMECKDMEHQLDIHRSKRFSRLN